jgi:hypothetical protein
MVAVSYRTSPPAMKQLGYQPTSSPAAAKDREAGFLSSSM